MDTPWKEFELLEKHIRELLSEQEKHFKALLDAIYQSHEERDSDRFKALEEQINRRFVSQERHEEQTAESTKSIMMELKEDLKRRFENVNEFRSQMERQERDFITKMEAEPRFANLIKSVDELQSWRSSITALTTGKDVTWTRVIAVIMAFAAIGATLFHFWTQK